MGRFLAVVTSLFLVALFASPVLTEETRPKFPPDETLSVPSLTLTDEQFLRGDTANGVPVTLTGELRFPNWDERLPAVVLLHGSDGARAARPSNGLHFSTKWESPCCASTVLAGAT